MGNSAPPPAQFQLVNSYARRRGGSVEIVLTRPDVPAPDRLQEAVLRRKGRQVRGSVSLEEGSLGPRLVVTADRDRLTDGTWKLRLTGPDVEPVGTRTRLLVQGERPLVLLWGGADPASRLPAAHPRPATPEATRGPAARRAVRVGSQVLDTVLAPLPDERRRATRQRARRVARRLLG